MYIVRFWSYNNHDQMKSCEARTVQDSLSVYIRERAKVWAF